MIAAGDTAGAIAALGPSLREHALDPDLHGLAAELYMASGALRNEGQLEAYAGRLLAPDDGMAWRRWASALMNENRVAGAIHGLEQYARLSPERFAADIEARSALERLRRMLPGGDLAQQALKREYRP
jgi:tetratricopeptide (TPR) repeat protein